MSRRILGTACALLLAAGVVSAVAFTGGDGEDPVALAADEQAAADTTATTTTAGPPTTGAPGTATTPTSRSTPTTRSTTAPATAAPSTTTTTSLPRRTTSTGHSPYATAGPVTLHHPAATVELIGYHQSGHDGAQSQEPVPGAAGHTVLEDRGRDTHPRGAADVVVDPGDEVLAPVTGTVIRAGSYTLYCDHTDEYLVIEPDDRPGWEVKVLHFEGLRVRTGQRVQGGVTVVGTGGRVLPFESQVDEETAEPSWPHVHIEVVDPSVPDRPTGPGCP